VVSYVRLGQSADGSGRVGSQKMDPQRIVFYAQSHFDSMLCLAIFRRQECNHAAVDAVNSRGH